MLEAGVKGRKEDFFARATFVPVENYGQPRPVLAVAELGPISHPDEICVLNRGDIFGRKSWKEV